MAQLAEALEAEAQKPPRPTAKERTWRPWLALAAAAVLAVVPWIKPGPMPVSPEHVAANPPGEGEAQAPDAGTAAVGDRASAEPRAPTAPPTDEKPLAQEPLPEPRPEQLRPDKRGQCPGRKQVPINGGCWSDVSASMDAQSCAENGYVLVKGKCFGPALATPKKPQPTSNPPEER